MNVELTAHQKAIVEHFMTFDGYTSAGDVIHDALHALKRELDLAAIKEGIEDMEAGRIRPACEVFDELNRRFGSRDDL